MDFELDEKYEKIENYDEIESAVEDCLENGGKEKDYVLSTISRLYEEDELDYEQYHYLLGLLRGENKEEAETEARKSFSSMAQDNGLTCKSCGTSFNVDSDLQLCFACK